MYAYEHFDDTVRMVQETPKYTLATGDKAFYIVSGVMKMGDDTKFLAGTAISTNKIWRYPIIELLARYPRLKNKKTLQEAAAQLLILQRKQPGFINPGDLGNLGAHGRGVK